MENIINIEENIKQKIQLNNYEDKFHEQINHSLSLSYHDQTSITENIKCKHLYQCSYLTNELCNLVQLIKKDINICSDTTNQAFLIKQDKKIKFIEQYIENISITNTDARVIQLHETGIYNTTIEIYKEGLQQASEQYLQHIFNDIENIRKTLIDILKNEKCHIYKRILIKIFKLYIYINALMMRNIFGDFFVKNNNPSLKYINLHSD